MEVNDEDGEGYFTSYIIDDFVVYRNPDIKPFAREVAEDEKMAGKARDRGQKGHGEYELPSAVYISHGVTNLRMSNQSLLLSIAFPDAI